MRHLERMNVRIRGSASGNVDRHHLTNKASKVRIEVEKEADGRWIAEVREIAGAMCYGGTREEAISKVESLVLRILADRIENGEETPGLERVFTVAA